MMFQRARLQTALGPVLPKTLAKGFVADVNSSLVEQLLNITLAEREAVVEPQGVPNHTQRKTVAIGLPVSHSSAAYQR